MFKAGVFGDLQILVVGDVMLDRYWFGDVDRISPEAPVPVIRVTESEERLGGAANVASNVSSLGGRCTLLSVIGEDDAGSNIRELLDDSGIEALLHCDPDINTTVKLRMVSRNQQLLRADFDTRPSHEILSRCLSDLVERLSGVHVVVISDYAKGGLKHIKEMITAARQEDVPVLIDPKGADFSQYYGATMITPNFVELQRVVGEITDARSLKEKSLELISELNLEYLLVTQSHEGMSLVSRSGAVTHSPARAKEVYDVSGAGDTVIGAMALCHAAGFDDAEKLTVANTAAGIVVGKLGTATVSELELVAALNDYEP